jgi:RimJ/RimL family protein N-acetyltransferase
VALGAKIVEKHFILDRTLGGPDAFFSLDPGEFRAMVDAVRSAEQALGSPHFGPSPGEQANTAFRRSLFVTAAVKQGEVLTVDNVRSVRPAHGLHPRYLPDVLGRVAARDLAAATPLAWDMVGAERPVAALTLRPATREDSGRLFAWRNDPVTRAMSITTAVVTQAEHDAWFEHSLTAPNRRLYVAEVGDAPVGTARLDAGAYATWTVSITVAPEQRGKGYAVALLRAVEDAARSMRASRLRAVLRPENTAVLRAFKAAGYYGFVDAEERGVPLLRCERRIVPFGS